MDDEIQKTQEERKKLEQLNDDDDTSDKAVVENPTHTKRNRGDQSQDEGGVNKKAKAGSDWDMPDETHMSDVIPGVIPIGGKPLDTPTPIGSPLYSIPKEYRGQQFDVPEKWPDDLLLMNLEDYLYFGPLLMKKFDVQKLSLDEVKERKVMKLLLEVKNGTMEQVEDAVTTLIDNAIEFGAGPLFNQILPLLMEPTLTNSMDLVRVIGRVLPELGESVRPYVKKILAVTKHLLMVDAVPFDSVRVIIYNLSKVVGLSTMTDAIAPDINHVAERFRDMTARAFSVVASALGIEALLPFLTAAFQSKRVWQTRHTAIKIVQEIATLITPSVVPHLRSLVKIIEHGLNDENEKIKTITAFSLAALAKAAARHPIEGFDSVLNPIEGFDSVLNPIEGFDSVLNPLLEGIRSHRGKVLAAFVKAMRYIIPLMKPEDCSSYTKEIMVFLIREQSQSPDEEMKKVVLKVVKQCVNIESVRPDYIQKVILPWFFKNFSFGRLDFRSGNYRLLVKTAAAISKKVGLLEIILTIGEDMKNESDQYKLKVLKTFAKAFIW